ncbi:hypothetical protein DASC09_027310 [Saccharomycopsis crataegensis]|uniref:Uncharacterized protein n=1 Tax=Saccharomycopsis crataegensis TaxID=43959 RepID=A0AAV5QL84_9ASCO|nr:hypothetical protein DASC09_027310 [Saccharomycopsis crataegensis]
MDVQVSIPRTSLIDGSYTVYHVSVRLPLRKYELARRYSDFYKLFHDMEEEMRYKNNKKFPLVVPPKTKFYQNSNDREVVEFRRSEFEYILSQIVNNGVDDDGDWRNTLAFEGFLELPSGIFKESTSGSTSNNNNKNNNKSNNTAMHYSLKSGVGGGNDPIIDIGAWLDTVRECRKLLQVARSLCASNPQQTRKNLIVVRSRFDPLDQGLKLHEINQKKNRGGLAAKDRSVAAGGPEVLGDGEIRRRKDLLSSLKQEHGNIESLLTSINGEKYNGSSSSSSSSSEKPISTMPGSFNVVVMSESRGVNEVNGLFGKKPSRRVLGQPLPETDETRGLGDTDLLQQQQLKLKTQDDELAMLSKAIQRQKMMGLTINEELDYQNTLLGELDRDVDNASTKLKYANKKTRKING